MASLDKVAEWSRRAEDAEAKAGPALVRLLELAETRDSGQVGRVSRFLAGVYDGQAFPFDLFELRALDVGISDDMLLCLDALRWAKHDLHKLVPDGARRFEAVIALWGLKWPERS